MVVESPRGAAVKLAWDPALGAFTLSRPLVLGVAYPYDWGFVPATEAPDGDPLDALVYWDGASWPGVVIPCRALGAVRLEQRSKKGGGRVRNDRVIAAPLAAPRLAGVRSVQDLPERVRDELAQFFVSATFFEEKDPRILGWDGPDEAEALVDRSTRRG